MRYLSIHRYLPLLVLVLLPCLLLWPVFAGRVLLPAHLLTDVMPWRPIDTRQMPAWNPLQFDGVAQFYPWHLFAARTLSTGFIPLWNPFEFCGTPFLANSQSAVLYPPNVLFVPIAPMYVFGLSALLHLSATGVFLYLFLRRAAGLGRGASLLGGIVWQLSTWQVAWLALPTFLDTSAWFPLALLIAHRLGEIRSWWHAACLGACLGLMLLAGHLQIALYGMMLVGAYAVVCLVRAREPFGRAVGMAAVTLAVAIGICAPQLLPTLELSRVSHRSGAHASTRAYRGYTALAMPLGQLATLYLPNLYGGPNDKGAPMRRPTDPPGSTPYHGESGYLGATNYAETACYVGVAALLLALVGAWSAWRRSPVARFFTVVAPIALLVALGTPLAGILYFGIPGFSQTGSPARILVLWSLAAAVLAAVGAQEVVDRRARLAVPVAAFGALALVTIGLAVASLAWLGVDMNAVSNDLRIAIAILLVLGIVVVGFMQTRIARPVAVALLVVLVGADLIGNGIGLNRCTRPGDVYPVTPLVAWLQAHCGPGDRVMVENRGWSIGAAPHAILPPNAGTVYGYREAQGYDSLQTGQYKSFVQKLDSGVDPSPKANGNIVFTWGAPSDVTREASLRYFVFAHPAWELGQPVYAGTDGFVYEDIDAIRRIASPVFPPRFGIPFREISPTRIVIAAPGAADVAIADQWYPGWVARQQGRELPVRRGPDVFRTVTGARPGRLELRYEPMSFRFGLYLMCAALAALVGLGVGHYRRSYTYTV